MKQTNGSSKASTLFKQFWALRTPLTIIQIQRSIVPEVLVSKYSAEITYPSQHAWQVMQSLFQVGRAAGGKRCWLAHMGKEIRTFPEHTHTHTLLLSISCRNLLPCYPWHSLLGSNSCSQDAPRTLNQEKHGTSVEKHLKNLNPSHIYSACSKPLFPWSSSIATGSIPTGMATSLGLF